MTILLLMLLGIALAIIFAGLLLSSPKVQAPTQRGISYADRGIGTRRERAMTYGGQSESVVRGRVATGQIYRSRYTKEPERRSLASVVAAFNPGNILSRREGKRASWLGLIFLLLALFGICLMTMKTLMIHPGLLLNPFDVVSTVTAPTKSAPPDPFAGLAGASKALIRVGQLDPAQYTSLDDYNKWGYSACSAAAMTEVINSYGYHYRIADILKVESDIGEITPALGLLEPVGIDRTVAHFGFKTVWLTNSPLNKIIDIANQGRPVIVGWPPERWSGGHILIVRGGNDKDVYLADSSKLNMQVMSRAKFTQYWVGFAVAVLPQSEAV